MTTHKREKALITFRNYIAKYLHRGQTNVKIKTAKKTKRTYTWANTCAHHTGKPVENEDAGK